MHRGLARIFALAFVLSGLGTACSSKTREGTLRIDLGGEADALSRAPAVTRLLVEAVSATGRQTLADATLPAPTLDLGKFDIATTAPLEVTGFDGAGQKRVFGRTLPFAFGALDGGEAPVFVQRQGELARLPGDALLDRRGVSALVLFERYVFVAGAEGDDDAATRAVSYDLFTLAAAEAPKRLPRPARSLVPVGDQVLVVDEKGGSFVNVQSLEAVEATAPAGGTFADVSGGDVVRDASGNHYLVGAGRPSGGAPSAHVLFVGVRGDLAFYKLAAPRVGATAVYVKDVGLVVADGTGEGAPQVEVLALPTVQPRVVPLPVRGVTGSSAVVLEGGAVGLVGGAAAGAAPVGVRFDPKCTDTCTTTGFAPALPTPFARTKAFTPPDGGLFVVGQRASDQTTEAYRVLGGAAESVALRVPRSASTPLASPLGSVLLVGGGDKRIESFVP